MKLADYSPPSSPTLADQEDALRKGLGRAFQWAEAGCLADEPLLAACLHDSRYDRQCEDLRADWLWELIQAAGARERLREPILAELRSLPDERSAAQLARLALHFAHSGDTEFRDRLYEIAAASPHPDNSTLAEDEVIELDGEDGFLFVARKRGERLATQTWDWEETFFVRTAEEHFGTERTSELLSTASDASVRRFFDAWREQESQPKTKFDPEARRERILRITADEIVRLAAADDIGLFHHWGRIASDQDLSLVLNQLWETEDVPTKVKLLRVFSRRALPTFDPRLIELCRSDNADLRNWAWAALEENSHPAVRAFALENLKPPFCGRVIDLFVLNYQGGDERLILDAFELPDDEFALHSELMGALKLLEKNSAADRSALGQVIYRFTPCEMCRTNALHVLVERSCAPEWMLQECRHDSSEEARKIACGDEGSDV